MVLDYVSSISSPLFTSLKGFFVTLYALILVLLFFILQAVIIYSYLWIGKQIYKIPNLKEFIRKILVELGLMKNIPQKEVTE